MRIAAISDLHGNLPPIPPCHILVVAGDICGGPTHEGTWRPDLSDHRWHDWLSEKFMPWASMAEIAIVVAGNHDTAIQKYGFPPVRYNVTYLCDSGIEVCGLRFWGSPWIKYFDGLAFNAHEDELAERYSKIPKGIDVLVSHGPPLGYGDFLGGKYCGSTSLMRAIEEVRPSLTICGHIHEARGVYLNYHDPIVNVSGDFTILEV